jgi:hypothetical protein
MQQKSGNIQDRENASVPTAHVASENIFFGISAVLFLAIGFFGNTLILNGLSIDPLDYALPLLSIIGFGVLFPITASIAKRHLLGFVIISSSAFASIFFATTSIDIIGIATGAIITLFLYFALKRAKSEYDNSINFRITDAVKASFSGIFTAIALLLSFYYLQVQLNQPINIIPRSLVESAVSVSESIFSEQLGNASEEIDANSLPPELLNILPEGILESIFDDGNSLEETALPNSSTDASSKIATDIADTIENKIDEIIGPYTQYIPYIFALFFFLSIRGVLPLLGFLITPLAYICMKILLVLRVVHIEKDEVEVKRASF